MMHHDTRKVFPGNGGWDPTQSIQAVNGTTTYCYTRDYVSGTWYWGVGQPRRPPDKQGGSWAYALLPYLDAPVLYEKCDWREPFILYVCPSRRVAVALVPNADARGTYCGGGWPWGKTDYAANALLVPNRPQSCRGLNAIRDGFAQTVLAGEKAMDMDYYMSGSWYWDEPFFLGGSGSTARDGTSVLRDARGTYLAIRQNWGSPHPDGAQFVFADGSVRLVPHGTPAASVKAILTPSGGEVAPEF
jgi:prepilin-type processing-associated H-X9-DG protein